MNQSEHQLIPAGQPGHHTCTVCGRTFAHTPRHKCPGVRQYAWGEAPAHLLNKKQLHEQGLRLAADQQPAGCIWYHKNLEYIWLYDSTLALPRPPATETQLASLAKARQALTCRGCGARVGRKTSLTAGFCSNCDYVIWARRCIADPDLRVFDTETTGLGETAQIISISIVDHQGNVLFDSLVRPDCHIPEDATDIHGISDEDVAGAPTWPQIHHQVCELLQNKPVIAYNIEFDRRMLYQTYKRYNIKDFEANESKWICLMKNYAIFTRRRRYVRLSYACEERGVVAGNHTSAGDALAAYGLLASIAAIHLPAYDSPAVSMETVEKP